MNMNFICGNDTACDCNGHPLNFNFCWSHKKFITQVFINYKLTLIALNEAITHVNCNIGKLNLLWGKSKL